MFNRIKPFCLGIRAGIQGGPTFTFDNDSESPRSVAFDRGMNLGERLTVTVEIWRDGPLSNLPKWL